MTIFLYLAVDKNSCLISFKIDLKYLKALIYLMGSFQTSKFIPTKSVNCQNFKIQLSVKNLTTLTTSLSSCDSCFPTTLKVALV